MPEINFCVIIPTYNNEMTIEKVIKDVLKFTPNIIVINDGSTDSTPQILKKFEGKIYIISNIKNMGKGASLKKGFRKAKELGYQYAITIDSDGQHFADDIPNFLEKLTPDSPVLIIGNRDMSGENTPQRSIFGRKFSNFWVKLETNVDVEDSQCGYRLYTLSEINKFHFFTNRYDFEIESLVRWLWKGLPVVSVPIKVNYPPPEERVSHFRGFLDNFRISILNTFLMTATIFYFMPLRLLKYLFKILKRLFSKVKAKRAF
ncbi:MAG: glycosyltransferase family 2 protein [Brevinematia bacterium]